MLFMALCLGLRAACWCYGEVGEQYRFYVLGLGNVVEHYRYYN